MSRDIQKAQHGRLNSWWRPTSNETLFRSASRVVLGLLSGSVLLTIAAVGIFWIATGRIPALVVAQSLARDAFALAAGVGAAIGLVVTYRRQKSVEDEALTQRYSSAAEQMGHVKAAVRLAGVSAMARLADDWEKQRQMCVDVLCAYLRMPCDLSAPDHAHEEERQVRKTVVRLIANHVKEKDVSGISWSSLAFDLSGAVLEVAPFNGATFSNEARFDGATFSDEATFSGATFSDEATFDWATFSNGATFSGATFSGGATFGLATFSSVAWFDGATFSGVATFGLATFSSGATFDGATFSGVAWFGGATFSNVAWFDGATFSSVAWFGWASFSNEARFGGATFTGEARFGWAYFSNEARFGGATFSSGAWFDGATFSSGARFDGATFSNEAWFGEATFSGGATFGEATYLDGSTGIPVAWQQVLHGIPDPLPDNIIGLDPCNDK